MSYCSQGSQTDAGLEACDNGGVCAVGGVGVIRHWSLSGDIILFPYSVNLTANYTISLSHYIIYAAKSSREQKACK